MFRYENAIVAAFPTVRGGAIHVTGLANGPTPAGLLGVYAADQEAAKRSVGDTPLSEIPSIGAWRRTFSAFGVKPTQYRSAVEALLRRLTKQGDIPSINLAVDVANLVSIRHRLPVAVFDQTAVSGATTVRFSDGTERFTDLGSGDVTNPEQGEVIFVDEAGLVSARRWCWRQSAESAADTQTHEALITVEGQHAGAAEAVKQATEDLIDLLTEYQPGARFSSALLSPNNPGFDPGHA